MKLEWSRGGFTISTDRDRIDPATVHGYLHRSYWAAGIPIEVVEKSIRHSLVFGLYEGPRQIGFARVVTDYATFAWLCDVFVLEAFRGRGLGVWLIECVVSHPELQGLRRLLLGTRDAHELYRKSGFTAMAHPERFMERWDPDVYRRKG